MQRSLPVLLLLLALLLWGSVPAQAQLVPPIQLQFFNSAGTGPAASGFLCTTQSGGSVSQLTYQDQALTVANQNPVRLNAAGRPVNGSNEVAVFLQQLNYRFTLYAAGTGNTCNGVTVGAQLKQVDGVNGVLVTGSAQIANLGLGAAADATARLLVSQPSNTATILIVNSSVNKNWGIYNITNGAATDLRFNESNASADRVTLQAGGNVGIGTTNPTETLHTNGTGRFTRIALGVASDATAQLNINGSKVYSDGTNLGINTTSPTGQLELRDTGTVIPALGTKSTGFNLYRSSDGTIGLSVGYEGTIGGTYMQAQSTGGSSFPIELNPRGGGVTIGAATPFTPAGQLEIRDAGLVIPALGTKSTGLNLYRTDGVIGFSMGYENAVGGTYMQAQSTGGSSFPIYLQPRGGNVGIGTTANPGALLTLGTGDVQWGRPLVALGGGAAPTFGTIGGSGPTAAAQNSWMKVLDSTGAAFWVPAWK